MSEIKRGAAVKLRARDEVSTDPWPVCCVPWEYLEGLDERGFVVTLAPACELSGDETDATKNVQVAAVVWEGTADEIVDDEADGMPKVAAWLVPVSALRLAEVSDA